MEPLIITGTEEIPTIILDKERNLLEISGQSIPEDAIHFYSPVIDWFEEYSKQPNPETILTFRLEYCNSSSLKAIVDILEILEEIQKKGKKVEVRWYYKEDDDDMLDVGKEFEEIMEVPITLIPVKSE